MAKCPGKNQGKDHCFFPLYRCTKCNSVGCNVSGCSNQCFDFNRCLRCGEDAHKKVEL